MNTSLQKAPWRIAAFLLAAAGAYALSSAALLAIPAPGKALLVGIAIPFDLMVAVPALFYILIVRKYRLNPVLMLPVIALGGVFVFQVARPENLVAAGIIAALAVAAEVTIALRVVRRLHKAYRHAKTQTADPAAWLYAPAYDLVRNRRAAKLLATELTAVYYGLFSWRKKPLVREGSRAFSYHRESGYVAMVGVVLCLLPVETFVVHLLVAQSSEGVAWALTLVSLYSALWILGDCRASVLRPVTVSGDTLTINSGIRFSAKVVLSAIESVGSRDPGCPKGRSVNLGAMGAPNTWITFSHDVETETFFGGKRMTRAIGLTLDDAAGFKKAACAPAPAARD